MHCVWANIQVATTANHILRKFILPEFLQSTKCFALFPLANRNPCLYTTYTLLSFVIHLSVRLLIHPTIHCTRWMQCVMIRGNHFNSGKPQHFPHKLQNRPIKLLSSSSSTTTNNLVVFF